MNSPPHRTGKFELLTDGDGNGSNFRICEHRNAYVYNEIGLFDLDAMYDLRSLADRAIRLAAREHEESVQRHKDYQNDERMAGMRND